MRAERWACSLGVFFVAVFLSGSPVVGASFIRGDTDASGQIDITDGIRILGYLFLGSPAGLVCEEASDADASRSIDISDAVYLLSYLFTGGAAPPAPFPNCGPSPATGGLGCAAYPDCGEQPTSFELINRALEAGEITAETALIYRVFHVFEDERLPAAFRGAAGGPVDTHLIAEVLERYGELSEDGRAVLDPFLLPPSAPAPTGSMSLTTTGPGTSSASPIEDRAPSERGSRVGRQPGGLGGVQSRRGSRSQGESIGRVWNPYTPEALAPAPLPIVRAEGAWLHTADGRAIRDAISSWWVILHGHNHPRLNAALRAQGAG